MQNMKYLTVLAAVTLFIGIVAILVAANPAVILLGKVAIAAGLFIFAATLTTYVMMQSFAAHALRNEDFHWH